MNASTADGSGGIGRDRDGLWLSRTTRHTERADEVTERYMVSNRGKRGQTGSNWVKLGADWVKQWAHWAK